MDREYYICRSCEHCFEVNDDIKDLHRFDSRAGACRAFPDGIDNFEIGSINSHDKPFKWQDNDLVYTLTARKINRFGEKIKIHQYINPFADENGRYNGK